MAQAQQKARLQLNGWMPSSPKAREAIERVRKVSETVKDKGKKALENVIKEKLMQHSKKLVAAVDEALGMPKVVRVVDQISFTLGVVGMLATEYFMLEHPQLLYIVWSVILPLLIISRFFMFHAKKWHYFMLDFCYFAQVCVMLYLYVYFKEASFFQVVFSLATGPLAFAIVPWKNSLVFHDWDRITSSFIHVYPSLVLYTLRWSNVPGFEICTNDACNISFSNSMLWPLVFYSAWQMFYLIKTELLDAHKLKADGSLITSLRWLGEKKPHPILQMLRKWGYKSGALPVLLITQFLYTVLTLLPIPYLWNNRVPHAVYLCLLLLSLTWSGASYYFKVFAERYAKKLEKATANPKKERTGTYLTSLRSLLVFLLTISIFIASLCGLINFMIRNPDFFIRLM